MIRSMVGDDAEMHQLIAEAHVSSQVAQMVFDARMSSGLTQQELAELVGTGQSAIARLEAADYDGQTRLASRNRLPESYVYKIIGLSDLERQAKQAI